MKAQQMLKYLLVLVFFVYLKYKLEFSGSAEATQTIQITSDNELYHEETFEAPPEQSKYVKKKSRNVPKFLGFELTSLKNSVPNKKLDIIYGITLGVIALIAYLGKRLNQVYVEHWLRYSFHVIRENFTNYDFDGFMTRELSWNTFEVFATGRRNCKYMNLYIKCIPRQCVWRGILLRLFTTLEDTVTVQFTMDSLDPIIFAMCPKREKSRALESSQDLKQFCRSHKSSLLSGYAILSESNEAKDLVLQPFLIKSFQNYGHYLKLVHISDHVTDGSTTTYKHIVRVVYRLPSLEKMHEIEPMIRFSMEFADFCANLHFPEKIRNTIKNRRYDIEKQINNNNEEILEAEEKKRIDKKKADEELFERLTPQQQRKYEEKQSKRQSKLKMKTI